MTYSPLPDGQGEPLSALRGVVGDNLQLSTDSRMQGPITRSSIVGYLPG